MWIFVTTSSRPSLFCVECRNLAAFQLPDDRALLCALSSVDWLKLQIWEGSCVAEQTPAGGSRRQVKAVGYEASSSSDRDLIHPTVEKVEPLKWDSRVTPFHSAHKRRPDRPLQERYDTDLDCRWLTRHNTKHLRRQETTKLFMQTVCILSFSLTQILRQVK